MKQAKDYIGFFDGMDGLIVRGWAYNRSNPEERVEVVVLVDGKPVAEGVADKFREDLKQAGIGDGKHAFEIKIPDEYADGKEHKVEVILKATGQKLPKSGLKFRIAKDYEYEIYGLIDWHIEGKIKNINNPNEPIEVELYENNKLIGQGISNPADNYRFQIWLPKETLDGKIHTFILRTKKEKLDIGYIIDITPYHITPYESLQAYSKESPYKLHPLARLRYEALKNNVKAIINDNRLSEEEKIKRIEEVYKAYEIVITGWEKLKEFPKLIFPKYEKPKVSIIIPVHNNFPLTYSCLASILLATYGVDYEVIIVDDGSSDETTRITNIVENIKYIRNETAQGFVLACNKGTSIAEGDYVLLLNNDTEVLDGLLKEMLYVFENFEKVGFVGAKLLYPDFTLQEAGAIVWGNGQAWNYGRGQNPLHPKFNYTRQVDYCSGACIMIPKKLWDKLGGFDEEFVPAYWEETDLAFRIRELGFKTVYTPFAQVVHYEGMTAGKDVKSGKMKKFQEINRKKFVKKWVHILSIRENEKPDWHKADLVKDRGIIGRVLAIDYEIPRPDREAGGYATFQELRLFQSLGFKVTFIPNNMAYLYGYVEDLQKAGIEVVYAPYYTSVKEFLEKRGKEFDIFYLIRWYIAKDYIDLIRSINPEAKILFNNADLHFLREIREAVAKNNKNMLVEALKTRDAELEVMKKVDLVLSYNDVEHAVILSHNLDKTKVARWPWVVCPHENVVPFEERKDIAFLGNYKHTPNILAVEFFVKEVMPILRKKIPGIKFLVYGANVTKEIKELESDDVIIKGYVKDLGDIFKTCRVFVAPLLTGAGIKGKVMEALSYGVPSVITPIAAEGTGIRNGYEALIAENPKEFAEAIYKLYTDKNLWQKISTNALELVKNEYSFEKGRELVRKALEMIDIYIPDGVNSLYVRRCFV